MAEWKETGRRAGGTVLRLALLSLAVGFVLSVVDVRPENLLARLGSSVENLFRLAVSAGEWAVPYVMLGAVVVVPIWLLVRAWHYVTGRRR